MNINIKSESAQREIATRICLSLGFAATANLVGLPFHCRTTSEGQYVHPVILGVSQNPKVSRGLSVFKFNTKCLLLFQPAPSISR